MAWVAPVLGPCPRSLMFLFFLFTLGVNGPPSQYIMLFSPFYTSFSPPSNVHVWVQFYRTDTCPISPYLKWLGVVVKAEWHGFVWRRVLNCSKGSLSLTLLSPHCSGVLSPLMLPGCLLTHSMRRWQFFLEPLLHYTPMCVLLHSPFLLGALWDAEDRIVLSYISRPFGLSLHALGNVFPRHGL